MNTAHYHLLVNHFPIILPIIGLLILVGGLIFKSELIKRTAYTIFIVAAFFSMASMYTGDGAEEVVENIPGVVESSIHTHEEAAELFAILTYVLGSISIVAFWASLKEKNFAYILNYLVIIFTVVVLFFAYRTGNTGGLVRHTELNGNATTTNTNTNQESGKPETEKDDDD
ncbi:MAG: hypothetical protein WCP57_03475 [Bacteroidota bacterium]